MAALSLPTKTRWHHIMASWPAIILLFVEGMFWISERFEWFSFNRQKGCDVLIAVASVGLTMVLIFIWFLYALLIRQRFEFSLRSVLLLTLVFAIPCSWLAKDHAAARKQAKVEENVKKAGGVFVYDYQLPPEVAREAPAAPRRQFGYASC